MKDYYEKLLLLDELKTIMPRLIGNSEYRILGGFARRMYMIENDIPMTVEDREALTTADIDVFIPIESILNRDTIDCDNEDVETKTHNISRELVMFMNNVRDCLNKDWDVTEKINDYATKVYDKQSCPIINTGMEQMPMRWVDNVKDRITDMVDLGIVLFENSDAILSPKNATFVYSLTPTIQLIFKDETVDEMVDSFDMENSKFELKPPFDYVTKIGNVSDQEIYYVSNFNARGDISPFKMMDRFMKYSRYGFKFSDDVKKRLSNHISNFIDYNDVSDLPSGKSLSYLWT